MCQVGCELTGGKEPPPRQSRVPAMLALSGKCAMRPCLRGVPVVVDAVLHATGRIPNTRGLGLETAGVELGESGEVIVDRYSASTAPTVYAAGDVTDRINLTPAAIR